jgi:hypothetical protein
MVGAILLLLTTMTTTVLFIFVYHGLLPSVSLRLNLIQQQAGGVVLVHLEIENKSQVRAQVALARLQILEYQVGHSEEYMSDWVPFTPNDIHAHEPPLKWREPLKLRGPQEIKGGEVVTMDVMYKPSELAKAIHCGFQLHLRINPLVRRLHGYKETKLSFTSTGWMPKTAA